MKGIYMHPRKKPESDGFEKAAEILIKRGAYLIAEGKITLPIVAKKGREDLLDLLLELNEPETTSTAFLHAFTTQNLGLFRRVLDHPELDHTALDPLGRTALHLAAWHSGLPFAKPLLDRFERADIED
ncbi:hypothetical protein B0J13DRAFT_616583 [Dactylonectria estremocensis]|uniref:Ankyrin repeat domain-containing protein n=1 Tax=Dactylonectria estremocensis TaxID=1079267 RepID=A0A9P9FF25_9HYPO|nr:hypothetical protein B0J13DRAFT_616583 [Dactylonectria estremocensis]